MTQTIIVMLLVLTAALYIGRRVWRTLRPKRTPGQSAGGCAGCGSNVSNQG
jgi:hypothetical protein